MVERLVANEKAAGSSPACCSLRSLYMRRILPSVWREPGVFRNPGGELESKVSGDIPGL